MTVITYLSAKEVGQPGSETWVCMPAAHFEQWRRVANESLANANQSLASANRALEIAGRYV